MRPQHARGIASVAAGVFVLLAGGSRAQDVSQQAGFRATAEIVQFDALFLDGEGRPVTDIRKEEVTVRQDGPRRPCATFASSRVHPRWFRPPRRP